MTEMTRHVHHVFGLWQQCCNLSRTDFRVLKCAFSIIVEYNIKSRYPEEYSTVDKTVSEEIQFRVELIASSFLIKRSYQRLLVTCILISSCVVSQITCSISLLLNSFTFPSVNVFSSIA